MRAAGKQFAILLLLLCGAAAQTTDTEMAKIRDILVAREGADLRVEILLSSPVEPVVTERHSDRLVLQLPNTSYFAKKIDVNADGVRVVRTRFDGVDGTEIVVDMDRAHPYSLTNDKNQIVLTLRSTASTPPPASRSTAIAHSPAVQGGVGSPQPTQISSAPTNKLQTSNHVPSPIVPSVASEVPSTARVNPPVPSSSISSATDSQVAQVASVPQNHTTFSPQGSAGQPVLPTAAAQPQSVPDHAPTVAAAAPVSPATSASETKEITLHLSDPSLRTVFRVKYVAEGAAYLDGGRSAGLKEGVKLEVQETDLPAREGAAVDPSDPRVVAELEVSALADTSAVTEVHSAKRPIKVGDIAYLSSGDAEALVQQTALSASRKYPAVVTFTEGDTLDEEAAELLDGCRTAAVRPARIALADAAPAARDRDHPDGARAGPRPPHRLADARQAGRCRADPQGPVRRFRRPRRLRACPSPDEPARDRHRAGRRRIPHAGGRAGRLRCGKGGGDDPRVPATHPGMRRSLLARQHLRREKGPFLLQRQG